LLFLKKEKENMSSLRNAVKRITHKERAQPRARKHLGLLEKKKDYVRRARDFHFKSDLLNKMRERASMRNPDEFYFGMKNAEVKNGRHSKLLQVQNKEREDEIGAGAVRIMKNQDLSYIRMQKQKDLKKVERMQSNLHDLETPKGSHIIFVEDVKAAKSFDPVQHFDTVPELIGRTFNRPRQRDLEQPPSLQMTQHHPSPSVVDNHRASTTITEHEYQRAIQTQRRAVKEVAKVRATSYRELQERTERASVLSRAESHLVTEKLMAGKGRRRKIQAAEAGHPAQYKWRRQRKS
jgi:U3 small nucleolar RNA-associated protein 11